MIRNGLYQFVSDVSQRLCQQGLGCHEPKRRTELIMNRISLLEEHLSRMERPEDIARTHRVIAYQRGLIRNPHLKYDPVIKVSHGHR